ncbi:MAG: type III pantothenate kinase, partial [Candidatus Bipolaricaulia bacterium]
MFLGLDAGNTNITVGCFRKDELVYTWRVSTDQSSTPDELGDTFRSLLLSSGVEPG